MSRRIAALGLRAVLGKGDRDGNLADRLHSTGDGAFVVADSDVFTQFRPSASATSSDRQYAPVAALLEPFAAGQADAVAIRLLDRFGSLSRAIFVDDEQLLACLGEHREVGERIVAARSLVEASLSERVTRSAVDPLCPVLHRYLAVRFRGRRCEELLVIYVDHNSGFISEDTLASGGEHSVAVENRRVLQRALETGAHGLLLAHNHPSLNPEPSTQDIGATRNLETLANGIGVKVIDHLIVAGSTVSSMRSMGLL